MQESGKEVSKWWKLENLNSEFLLQYAKPEEFYVALVIGKPAAAAILQLSQSAQDWHNIDKGQPRPALYIHWLCVSRKHSGKGLPKTMVDFAEQKARENGISLMRVDTNAKEKKLREIYEGLGFELAGVIQEDYRTTAFYQKNV